MKVYYILHSGFCVETDQSYYLFDYYKGKLPDFDPAKKIYVFSSHSHPDHYNPFLFRRFKEAGVENERIHCYLAKDIPAKKYPDAIKCTKVYAHQDYSLPDGSLLHTLLSTDQGVAFLLKCEEGTIYHAGDLNDWYWEGETEQANKTMSGMYRKEIDNLKDCSIDLAFVPLDPRQEIHYDRGMLYFLKTAGAKAVYPMHYWKKPEVIDRFIKDHPEYQDIIMNPEECST